MPFAWEGDAFKLEICGPLTPLHRRVAPPLRQQCVLLLATHTSRYDDAAAAAVATDADADGGDASVAGGDVGAVDDSGTAALVVHWRCRVRSLSASSRTAAADDAVDDDGDDAIGGSDDNAVVVVVVAAAVDVVVAAFHALIS